MREVTQDFNSYESMLEGLKRRWGNEKIDYTVHAYGGPRIMKVVIPEIKDVIFNDPATIVLWSDSTKTVVKCQEGDEFDPEKGLTMAIAKKAYGNKGSYCNVIKKWCEPYWEKMAEEREGYFKAMAMAMLKCCNLATEWVDVTEHYGYSYQMNPDTSEYEYYVAHISSKKLIDNPERRNLCTHTPNLEEAKALAKQYEHVYYGDGEKEE